MDHDEVVVDDTVVRPSTHGVDSLLGCVELGTTGGCIRTVADTVDLLVEFRTVVVTVLTRSCNGEHNVGRVPCTNTSDLTETTVGLAGQLLGSPTGSNTFVSVTLGNSDDVQVLVGRKDRRGIESLFEARLREVDLVGNRTTVDLDFHQVGLLLLETGLADLGVGEDTNDSAVLLDTLEFTVDALTIVLTVLLGVFGEGLLLAAVPVLVESALDLVRQVLSPHGSE